MAALEQRVQVLEDELDTTRQLLSVIVDKVGQLEEEKNGDLSRLDEIRNDITEVKEEAAEEARIGKDRYEKAISEQKEKNKEVINKLEALQSEVEESVSGTRVPMGTEQPDSDNSEKLEEITKTVDELTSKLAAMEAIPLEVQDRIKLIEEKIGKAGKYDDEAARDGIKGFNTKNMPKPEPIDVHGKDSHEFNAWHDLFVAYATTHDAKWEHILNAIEEFGKDAIDKVGTDRIKVEHGLTADGVRKVKQWLYLNLLQFTKGDTHSRTVAAGMDAAMETYRLMVLKGKNSTVTSLMDQRMRIMQPDKAKTMDEVDMKVTQWKADIRILRESRQRQDVEMVGNDDQMITILIGMLPDVLADHLISKYSPGSSKFEDMLVEMQDHLMKVDQRKTAKRMIKQVARKEEEEEETQADKLPEEKMDWRFDEAFGWYLCTAAPAPKRQRTEDEGASETYTKGNTKGRGKGDEGKGKGKSKGKGKGPAGGCHECGGDHFVRDCHIRAQRKGGQKGKGKSWDSVPTRQWSQWNPGFIPQQWGGWRPGNPNGQFGKGQFGKGGGKGVGQVAGKGADYSGGESFFDLNRLQFPALASVNYQAEEYPSSADMEWNGSSADGSQWTMVVTKKKKPKFEKMAGIAEEIHKAMSYTTSNHFGALEEEAEDKVTLVDLEGPHGNHQKTDKNITQKKVRLCSRKVPCEEKCCGTVTVRRVRQTSSNSVDRVPMGTGRTESDVSESGDDGMTPGLVDDDDDDDSDITHVPARQASSNSVDRVRIGTGSTESGVAESVPGIRVPMGTGQPGSESSGAGEDDGAGFTDWRQDEKIVNRKLQFFRKHSPPKTIAPVEQKGKADGWTCLSMAVDSGACDNVISPKDLPNYQNHIRETTESLKGEGFVSATGEDIPNFGEVILPVITRERQLKSITFQAAGVAKPLLSAEKLNKSGQLVIFDGDQSCIVNKSTYEVMALRREEGNFMLDVWIPPAHVAEQMGFPGHP